MPAIKPTRIGLDLDIFFQLAALVERQSVSLRRAANSLGCSPTAITSCLQRLERVYGEELIRFTVGRAEPLTSAGKQLYRNLSLLRAPELAPQSRPLLFHVSHSIVTSRFFADILRMHAMDFPRGELLRPRTEMDFDRVVAALQRDELEFAITWGFEQRLEDLPMTLIARALAPPIHLALVCRNEEVLCRLGAARRLEPEAMLRLRIVGLNKSRQPKLPSLPNDWQLRGNYIEVDTFAAAVAYVRSGVADVTIVPGFLEELERSQVLGELTFSILDQQLGMTCITQRGKDLRETADALLDRTEAALQRYDTLSADRLSASAHFPHSDTTWFEKMRYGYYIETDRRAHGGKLWKKECILFSVSNTPHGFIQNDEGAVFIIEQTKQMPYVVQVSARKMNKEVNSVQSFVSVFTRCFESPGVMVGLWAGAEARPFSEFQATIWSHKKLSDEELQEYSRSASTTLVLNASAYPQPHSQDHDDRQFLSDCAAWSKQLAVSN